MAEPTNNDDELLLSSTEYEPSFQIETPQVAPPPARPPDDEQGFWNQFYGSIGSTVFQDNPRLSGRAIEGLGRVSGSDPMKDWGQAIVDEFDESPEDGKFIPRVSSYSQVEGFNSLMDYMGSSLGQGLGSMTMVMGGAAVGAGVGAGAGAVVGSVAPGLGTAMGGVAGGISGGAIGGTVASSFLLNYGDTYDYLVVQEGMGEDEAARFALVPGSIMAGLDSFAVTRIIGPSRQALSRNLIKRTMQLAGRGGTTEGLTEAAQQVVQEFSGELAEAAGYATEDIEFAQRLENTINSLLVGWLTGTVVGGATAPVMRPEAEPEGTETEAEPEVVGLEVEEEEVQGTPRPAEEETAPAEPVEEAVEEPVEEAVEEAAEEAVEEAAEPVEKAVEDLTTSLSVNWNAKWRSPALEFLSGITSEEIKIDDLYREDDLTGQAGGSLSKFPAAEIRLFRLDDFLLDLKWQGWETVTKSDLMDYIMENKWRMDFREVRRQTAEATGESVDPRLELEETRAASAWRSVQDMFDDLHRAAESSDYPNLPSEERPYSSEAFRRIAEAFHSTRGFPALLHRVKVDPYSGLTWIDHEADENISDVAEHLYQVLTSPQYDRSLQPLASKVPGGHQGRGDWEPTNPRPPGHLIKNDPVVAEAQASIEPLLDWMHWLQAPEEYQDIQSEMEGLSAADLRAQMRIPELIDKIKKRITALGGRERLKQLRGEIGSWLVDNSVPIALPEESQHRSPEDEILAKSRLLTNRATRPSTQGDPLKPLNKWVMERSIYSERMPKRQKAVFMSGFEKIKSKSDEAAMIQDLIDLLGLKGTYLPSGRSGLSQLEALLVYREQYEGVINSEEMRSRQRIMKGIVDLKAEIEASKPPAPAEGELGYKISKLPLKHPGLSLQGTSGNKRNNRQIIMINPAKGLEEFRRIMESDLDPDEGTIDRLRGSLYDSHHWDDWIEVGAGIHIRVTDQIVIIDGVERRILLIEELQYDHGQDHKKHGTRTESVKMDRLRGRLGLALDRIVEMNAEAPFDENRVMVPLVAGNIVFPEVWVLPERVSEVENLRKIIVKLNKTISYEHARRPEASFPNTADWVQIGVRRAFQIAAEEGYYGVAFIGGASSGPITAMPTKETRANSILIGLKILAQGDPTKLKKPAEKLVEIIEGFKLRSARGTGSTLNEAAYNETVEKNTGIMKWIQQSGTEGLTLQEVISYLSQPQLLYPGSSANVHYDLNVAKQAELVAGRPPLKAIDDLVFIVNGRPITDTTPGVTPELRSSISGHISFPNGVAAYKHTPPNMWLLDEKLQGEMVGAQPLLSTAKRAVAVEGDWGKPISALLEPYMKKRKEGVVYFEDMKPVDRLLISHKIAVATSGLPSLEYPFTASLGKPGGAAVTVVGHMKGNLLSVEMPNGKSSRMPASNLFVGTERLVEAEPPRLVKTAIRDKIRAEHLKGIRKALAEGLDVPEEVLKDYHELLGSGTMEEDQEVEAEAAPEVKEPWQMTRAEFDETGQELMHGTSKEFERFESKAAKDRFNRQMGNRKESLRRFYFTEKPQVGHTFANSGGFKQVVPHHWNDEIQDLDWDDPARRELEQEMLEDLRKAFSKHPGSTLSYTDEGSGDLLKVDDPSEIPMRDYYDGDVRLYAPGRWPKIIKTNVYGRTLDLTDPKNIPEGLTQVLKGFDPSQPGHGFLHENSEELIDWARENNYGKVKVKDVYESGFESIIALEEYIGYGIDPHRTFVEKAVKEGKDVPIEVLKGYPDLYALKWGTPARPEPAPKIDTPEFKKWFGDSKVADKAGKPLVVYHGTPKGKFSEAARKSNLERERLIAEKNEIKPDLDAANALWDEMRLEANRAGTTLEATEKAALEKWRERIRAGEPDVGRFEPFDDPDYMIARRKFLELQDAETAFYRAEVKPLSQRYNALRIPKERKEEDVFRTLSSGLTDFGYRSSGSYFTDSPEKAEGYARQLGTKTPYVYKVYLSLQNPYIEGETKAPEGMFEEMERKVGYAQRSAGRHWFEEHEMWRSNIRRQVLEKYGFDGEIWGGGSDPGTEYIAFKPTQIKSVENIGTFDPKDPDIMRGIGIGAAALPAAGALMGEEEKEPEGE